MRLFTLERQLDFLSDVEVDEGEHEISFNAHMVDRISTGDEKPYMVHLETHVCDHCNLNCKACNNFSPFVKEPIYADLESFERDIRRLSELFSGIGRFFLLGGEPLLAPELCCEMIKIYRRYFPRNELRVLTNATRILVMEDWFWDCLRKNEVIIHISLYPPMKKSIDAVEDRLKEKGISYLIFKIVERFAKKLTEYPFEDANVNNLRCGSGGCHYLRDGVIAKCPDAWLSKYLPGELGGRFQSKDILDFHAMEAWEIIKRANAPIDLCKYCACTHMETVVWEPVGTVANPADWFTKHKFAYDNERLQKELNCAKEKLDDSNTRLDERIRELDEANKKIESTPKLLNVSNAKLETAVRAVDITKAKLNKAQNDIRKLDNAVEELRQTVADTKTAYDRIEDSISYRIGRGITWLPRKWRRFRRAARRCGVWNAVRGTYEKRQRIQK